MTYLSFINQFSKKKIIAVLEREFQCETLRRIAYKLHDNEQKVLIERMLASEGRMKACAEEMKAHPGDISKIEIIERFHKAYSEWDKANTASDRLFNQIERLRKGGLQ